MRNGLQRQCWKKAEFSSSIQSNYFFYVGVRMCLRPCHERGVLGLFSGQLDTKVALWFPGTTTRVPSCSLHLRFLFTLTLPPDLFPFKEHILFICPPYALFIRAGWFWSAGTLMVTIGLKVGVVTIRLVKMVWSFIQNDCKTNIWQVVVSNFCVLWFKLQKQDLHQ